MNDKDLRLRYKLETGFYPTWGGSSKYATRDVRHPNERLKNASKESYYGNLTHEYALWLENHYSNDPYKIRMKYKLETGNYPIYRSCNFSIVSDERYTNAYKEWLEDYIIESLKSLYRACFTDFENI